MLCNFITFFCFVPYSTVLCIYDFVWLLWCSQLLIRIECQWTIKLFSHRVTSIVVDRIFFYGHIYKNFGHLLSNINKSGVCSLSLAAQANFLLTRYARPHATFVPFNFHARLDPIIISNLTFCRNTSYSAPHTNLFTYNYATSDLMEFTQKTLQ